MKPLTFLLPVKHGDFGADVIEGKRNRSFQGSVI
jgi:hypothetical protein